MHDAITSDACETTLDIADDVLQAAKERAKRERKTTGETKEPKAVYGLKPFARRGAIVTNELIDKLRDEGAY
jgi:hypothetical protein